MNDYFSLEQLREAERLFASKHECSPAVSTIGRALLREYQLGLVEVEKLREALHQCREDYRAKVLALQRKASVYRGGEPPGDLPDDWVGESSASVGAPGLSEPDNQSAIGGEALNRRQARREGAEDVAPVRSSKPSGSESSVASVEAEEDRQ